MGDDTPPPEWWDSVPGAVGVTSSMSVLTAWAAYATLSEPDVGIRSVALGAAVAGLWASARHLHDVLRGPSHPHVAALMKRWRAAGLDGPSKTPAMLREEADAFDADGCPDLANLLRHHADLAEWQEG